MKDRLVLIAFGMVGLSACSSGDSDRANKVRDALGKTQVSLAQSISVVEANREMKLLPTRAMLIAEADPRFTIHANGDGAAREIQVDKLGNIIATNAIGAPATTCPGATTLKDAAGIAEGATAGKAFQIQPDDDDACLYEVQTLAGSTIWEVKIDRNGAVIEKEDATNDTED